MPNRVWRLRGRSSFELLRHRGVRTRADAITVTWVPSTDAQPARVGYAIGRRAGGAVQRNRLRRRLRGITHEVSSQLSPGLYLISAGPPAISMPYPRLRAAVSDALGSVGSRHSISESV